MRRLVIVSLLIGITTIGLVGQKVAVFASNVTFAGNLNLSNDPSPSDLPRITATGANVYVAWLNSSCLICNSNILFRASSDNGSSFGPVIKINNVTAGNSEVQEIAAAGSNVYLVWQQNVTLSRNDIFFRDSTNFGASFGPIIDVSGGLSSLSTSTVPQVSTIGNNVYVVWLALNATDASNEVLFKVSASNGSDLASVAPRILTKTAYGSAMTCTDFSCFRRPQTAASGSFVYVTWNDIRLGRSQPFFAYFSNNGATFVASRSLATPSVGENDSYTQIAVTGTDVYVTWTNDTVSSDNAMFAASTNNGASFAPALNLNEANVFDLNPQPAASGNNVYVVWSDATGTGNTVVLYRSSANNGATFGATATMSTVSGTSNQQVIAAAGTNVYVAWLYQNSTGTVGDGVYFVSSGDSGSTFGSAQNLSNDSLSNGPVLAGSGVFAYASWEDDSTGGGDIYFNHGSSTVSISPPTSVLENFLVTENQSKVLFLRGYDSGGIPLTFSVVIAPSHGTLGPITSTGSSTARVTYTPASGYTGTDSFTYRVWNGFQASSSTAVYLVVSLAPLSGWGGGAGGGGGLKLNE